MKIFQKIFHKIFSLFLLSPLMLFSAEGVLGDLVKAGEDSMKEAGSQVASIFNTISIVFGALWILYFCYALFFNIEQMKQYFKWILVAAIVLGIIYYVSSKMM